MVLISPHLVLISHRPTSRQNWLALLK